MAQVAGEAMADKDEEPTMDDWYTWRERWRVDFGLVNRWLSESQRLPSGELT